MSKFELRRIIKRELEQLFKAMQDNENEERGQYLMDLYNSKRRQMEVL